VAKENNCVMNVLSTHETGLINLRRESMSCSAGAWDTFYSRFGCYSVFSGKFKLSKDITQPLNFSTPTLICCMGEKVVYELDEGISIPLEPGFARLIYAPSVKALISLTKSKQYHIFSISFTTSFLAHEDLQPLVDRELLRFERQQGVSLIKSAVSINDWSFSIHSIAEVLKGQEKSVHMQNTLEHILNHVLNHYEKEIYLRYYPNGDFNNREKPFREWESL
jgi:hypothetical protein